MASDSCLLLKCFSHRRNSVRLRIECINANRRVIFPLEARYQGIAGDPEFISGKRSTAFSCAHGS